MSRVRSLRLVGAATGPGDGGAGTLGSPASLTGTAVGEDQLDTLWPADVEVVDHERFEEGPA